MLCYSTCNVVAVVLMVRLMHSHRKPECLHAIFLMFLEFILFYTYIPMYAIYVFSKGCLSLGIVPTYIFMYSWAHKINTYFQGSLLNESRVKTELSF